MVPEQFVPKFIRRWMRLYEIWRILAHHGFLDFTKRIKLLRFLPGRFQKRISGDKDFELPLPVRVRKVIEELGPTFVKLGQVMSARPDIFPADFIQEFSKLQDEVPPFPFEQVRAVIESEMGRPLEDVYSSFDGQPIASASVGQVHRAVLASGQEVVVKVQRPNIGKTIAADTDIMRVLAARMERSWEFAKRNNLVERVNEFDLVIRQEMNYLNEAGNAERLKRNLAEEENIYVPSIHWDYTTRRVLTMEYIHGIKIKDKKLLIDNGYDMAKLTEVIAHAYIKMTLEDGFFHGDPHFGNLFVMEGGVVAMIDFGMVGVISSVMKRHMAKYFIALVNQDAEAFVEALSEVANIDHSVDLDALTRDVGRKMVRYAGLKLGQVHFDELAQELIQLAVKYKVGMPGELIMMEKTLVTLEGLGRHLNPDFDLMDVAGPAAKALIQRDLSAKTIGGHLLKASLDGEEFLQALPGRLNKITRLLEKGRLRVKIDQDDLSASVHGLGRSISGASRRLGLGIVLAALIVAFPPSVNAKVELFDYVIPCWKFLTAAILFVGFFFISSIIADGRRQ